MSGRSAYVRKKITGQKASDKNALHSRSLSKHSNTRIPLKDGIVYDYPVPPSIGHGSSHPRLPKSSDPKQDDDDIHYRSELATLLKNNGGTPSGGSDAGMRENDSPNQGPMADYAYARARKPIVKTDDVTGIERSGFRSAVDKKSEHIRRGLTKAFTLGLKKKREVPTFDRAQTKMTLRPHCFDPDNYNSIKISTVPNHVPYGETLEADCQPADTTPPPSVKCPSSPTFIPTSIKRWIGGGRPIQRWNKLRKDPELWDPNGDVLVYLGPEDQPQLNPSFRLSSHIIEATESRFLVTLLREGSTENDYSRGSLSPSPIGAPPMLRANNSYAQLERTGQATPPGSEDNVRTDVDGQVSYKIFFSVPSHLTGAEAHCHVITTRNVFALLYNASLVGTSLFQALRDLLDRLVVYMQPEADNVGRIVNYLATRNIDDVRNDPESAVSILAWSETQSVRWEEGWREAFLHCTGMYSRLENCADYRHLTPITRALLERACLETQLRVHAAEERLGTFAFADIWGSAANITGKVMADRLRQFLLLYYTKACGTWPPIESGAQTTEGEMWLTRRVAQMLQKDFGALYDYLVNRDIVWDESETRSTRKWMMVSESGNKSFDADTEDLPLTDILIEFDNRMRYPHIPHPYPLVPEPIPAVRSPLVHHNKTKRDKNARQAADDRTLERRIQLAYTEATNIYNLGSEFAQSDLLDNFVKFEKSDHPSTTDPSSARRSRWVLIYAILQTLATISVDAPNVRFKDGVSYHLSPRLPVTTRMPPWKGACTQAARAIHELSHCWLAPCTWQGTPSGAESESSEIDQMQMMRERLRRFPRPPRSRSGWQTASVRSATPTMWGGSSAMSVSNFSDVTVSSSGRMRSLPDYHMTYSHKVLPPLPPRSPRREDEGGALINVRNIGSLDAHFKGRGQTEEWVGKDLPYSSPKIQLC